MSKRKNNGIVRRPIEYVLLAIAGILIVCLLWSLSVIRSQENPRTVMQNNLVAGQEPVGTLSEIETSLEKEFSDENIVYSAIFGDAYRTFLAAADNLGGVYDESDMSTENAAFCDTLPDIVRTMTDNFATRQTVLDRSVESLRADRAIQAASSYERVQTLRKKADSFRVKSFDLLQQNLPEDSMSLYHTYQQALSSILKHRRQQNDARYSEFSNKANQFTDQQIAQAQAAAATFRLSFDTAVEAAQGSCRRSGTAGSLVQELQAARLRYGEYRRRAHQASQQVSDQYAQELENSNISIKRDFEQALQAVRPRVGLSDKP